MIIKLEALLSRTWENDRCLSTLSIHSVCHLTWWIISKMKMTKVNFHINRYKNQKNKKCNHILSSEIQFWNSSEIQFFLTLSESHPVASGNNPSCLYDVLRNLVPFVQFKKREKHPCRSVTFSNTKSNTLPDRLSELGELG